MPKALSLEVPAFDISVEVKQLSDLTFKLLQLLNRRDVIDNVISMNVSAAYSCATHSCYCPAISQKQSLVGKSRNYEGQLHFDYTEARNVLFDMYNSLHHESGKLSSESVGDSMLFEYEADLATSKQLMILESCFHFVNNGGMEQLGYIITHYVQNSHAITLMVLGCEGFLGWWPHEDECIPLGTSVGYNEFLKLLLQKQPHDVAFLATHILHRLRFYEVASRYESSVLSALASLSTSRRVTNATVDKLTSARFQLKTLMKMINSRAPLEDPSPLACTSRLLLLGETEGVLSYKSTCSLITSSNCWFSNWDIDSHLLFLLKERGFFPLSAALLSSISRSQMGNAVDIFVDIASYLEAVYVINIFLSFSGLIFLLHHPELSTNVILALRGSDGLKKEEPLPLRYASVLISKGFVSQPEEIGMIVEKHLRVVNAIDCLLTSDAHSEEILWVLWSQCGRHALLAVGHFLEPVSVLIAALQSIKGLDPDTSNSGFVPLNLAVFHSAAEIFEVIVTDLTASSLGSWIGNATELHRALNFSSPGSNRKDAPTRLLEWVDASIVYHRKGATGLLQYIDLLVSGGDPHMALTSILLADTMDVENMVGDSSTSSDGNLIENLLGKPISENSYRAAVLRAVMVMVIHAVLIDCRLMLERCYFTCDLRSTTPIPGQHAGGLIKEGRDQLCHCYGSILKDSGNIEQDREASLLEFLGFLTSDSRGDICWGQGRDGLCVQFLGLRSTLAWKCPKRVPLVAHVSPLCLFGEKLNGRAMCCLHSCLTCIRQPDDLVDEGTEGNSTSDLLLERTREQGLVDLVIPSLVLLVSLLQKLQDAKEQHRNTKLMKALLHTRLASCAADLSSPYPCSALGLEAACHLLVSALVCWPVYGWTPGLFSCPVDSLHATSLLALGPKEACCLLCLLNDQLPEEGFWLWKNGMPMLSALRTLAVGSLLGPQIGWYLQPEHLERVLSQLMPQLGKIGQIILHCAVSGSVVEVYRLLDFLSILLEHPCAKEGAFQMLIKVLERCIAVADSDEKQFCDNRNMDKCGFPLLTWPYQWEENYLLVYQLLRSYVPAVNGKVLCILFSFISSPVVMRNVIYLDSKDIVPDYAVEAVDALSSGALCFCMDGIRVEISNKNPRLRSHKPMTRPQIYPKLTPRSSLVETIDD
ncbi:hypothetical protein RHGRI_017379 [Rhododendron griersonianum]|uniref:Uncharacterized protein n=1 Tax=Rhododendron griersonianum TaxID=479676 RepID=A0AAV6JXJ7_9ERIC|nr:hypothetical protein RHGRI_017379 [Rhododendron griersonianum]